MSTKNKIILAVVSFVALVMIVSVGYLLLNPAQPTNTDNPGGTGGDYSPANSVAITNDGVLNDYFGDSNATSLQDMIKTAVLYNISISNDPSVGPEYTKSAIFDPGSAVLYKENTSYTATIDGDAISQIDQNSWDYYFNLTTNDHRHFRVDTNVNPDNDSSLISIKPMF